MNRLLTYKLPGIYLFSLIVIIAGFWQYSSESQRLQTDIDRLTSLKHQIDRYSQHSGSGKLSDHFPGQIEPISTPLDLVELIQAGIKQNRLKLVQMETIRAESNTYQVLTELNISVRASYSDWLRFRYWMSRLPVNQDWKSVLVKAINPYRGETVIEEQVLLVVDRE